MKMKICALLLTAVVVLNSVDPSSQGNFPSFMSRAPPYRSPSQSPSGSASRSRSRSPSPASRREPSPPRTTYPKLIQRSLIIKSVKLPDDTFLYKLVNENRLEVISNRVNVVLNYERKIVAIFLEMSDTRLYGLYHYRSRGRRIKLNPACIDDGSEHVDELDGAGYQYYPEFHDFEKHGTTIIESLEAYRKLGRGLACSHTELARSWFFLAVPGEAHIVRGVQFPQGFYFKINMEEDLFHPLAFHKCDVMVDQFKMIVAAFLGPTEYKLFGIYREIRGKRVKIAHPSMEAQHFKLNHKEEF